MFTGFLYEITHTSSRRYYGIVFAAGKTPDQRFQEHLSGRGSRRIADMIAEGADPSEFTLRVVRDDFESLDQLRQAEIDIIREQQSLWPLGLNGNCGHQIRCTPEARARGVAKRLAKIKSGRVVLKGLRSGTANYRYPDGTVASETL